MPKTKWGKPRLPIQLEEILREKRLENPGGRWWIRSSAKCTNRRMRSLLVRYLFRELNEQDRRAFERHVRSCIECGAIIHDAFELQRDLKPRGSKP